MNNHVPTFAGVPVGPFPELPAQDDSTPDSRAEREQHQTLGGFARSGPVFGECSGVCVVDENRGSVESLTNEIRMNLHIDCIRGRNPHHMIEAMFKAMGRAMDQATQYDPRIAGVLSTKGLL